MLQNLCKNPHPQIIPVITQFAKDHQLPLSAILGCYNISNRYTTFQEYLYGTCRINLAANPSAWRLLGLVLPDDYDYLCAMATNTDAEALETLTYECCVRHGIHIIPLLAKNPCPKALELLKPLITNDNLMNVMYVIMTQNLNAQSVELLHQILATHNTVLPQFNFEQVTLELSTVPTQPSAVPTHMYADAYEEVFQLFKESPNLDISILANPHAIVLDGDFMRAQSLPLWMDLISYVLHPRRLRYYLDNYGYNISTEEYGWEDEV